MANRKLNREEISNSGLEQLTLIGSRDSQVNRWKTWLMNYQFAADYSDDDYSWFACVLALEAVGSGNFGVGSLLVNSAGNVTICGHNEVFYPYFRSDRHAEMVVMDKFEDACQHTSRAEGYAVYTSLESCPMCLARLITSRIGRVLYVAEDSTGGMVNRLKDLPTIWIELATSQTFGKASCSQELVNAARQIFSINAQELNEILRKRQVPS